MYEKRPETDTFKYPPRAVNPERPPNMPTVDDCIETDTGQSLRTLAAGLGVMFGPLDTDDALRVRLRQAWVERKLRRISLSPLPAPLNHVDTLADKIKRICNDTFEKHLDICKYPNCNCITIPVSVKFGEKETHDGSPSEP
jgi:hypothetical protein